MTRGRRPEYADTELAQFIKEALEEREWNKKRLAEELRAASGGRLGKAGADRLVTRATHGGTAPLDENLDLLEAVLGPIPVSGAVPQTRLILDRLAALEAQVVNQGKAVTAGLYDVTQRLALVEEALERRVLRQAPAAPRTTRRT